MVREKSLRTAHGGNGVLSSRQRLHPLLDGIARIFDFTGSLNQPVRRAPLEVKTARAMDRAWQSVGDSLRAVMAVYPPERLRETQETKEQG